MIIAHIRMPHHLGIWITLHKITSFNEGEHATVKLLNFFRVFGTADIPRVIGFGFGLGNFIFIFDILPCIFHDGQEIISGFRGQVFKFRQTHIFPPMLLLFIEYIYNFTLYFCHSVARLTNKILLNLENHSQLPQHFLTHLLIQNAVSVQGYPYRIILLGNMMQRVRYLHRNRPLIAFFMHLISIVKARIHLFRNQCNKIINLANQVRF